MILTRAAVIVCALGLLGLIAACRAPGDASGIRWQKPDTSESQALDDELDCRRRASAEIEREARRERIFTDDGLIRPGSLDGMMARHDATLRVNRLASECMRRRGYVPAPR